MSRFHPLAIPTLALALAFAAAQVGAERTEYEIPGDDTYPEGIAHHPASDSVFVGGAVSGAIYRVHLATGTTETLLEPGLRPPFSTLGMAVDDQDRLWVAGGASGEILRIDTGTGELSVAIQTPPAEELLLNDLVVAPNGDVYVTDSYRPVLYRVPAGTTEAEAWLEFAVTPLEYQEGINANGIEVTDDGAYLIVVQMNTGMLYRVQVSNREVTPIDLGDARVEGGDGLVLDGTTLYVVQNGPDQVSVVELADDYASGTLTRVIEDERLQNAATAALVDGNLLITNAQFDAMATEPELPFTVVVVPVD